LVTCIQEKLDNSRLTVRVDGKVVGQVVQDAANKWIALPPPQPPPQTYPTLESAVSAMVNKELGITVSET
jgi:hypothetical protein